MQSIDPTFDRPPEPRRQDAGVSLVEVLLAMVMVAVGLSAVAGVFGASIKTGVRSKELSESARFLERVMASVNAQSYDALLAMNGNVIYDEADAAQSRFEAELSTKVAGVSLTEVVIVLRDRRDGREQGRIGTYRSRH